MEVAGRELGFSATARQKAVTATLRAYREAMAEFADMRNIDVWYARLPADELRIRLSELADRQSSEEAKRRIRQALERDHLCAFEKLVERDGDQLQFVSKPPLLTPIEELLLGEQRDRYSVVASAP